MNVLTLFLSSRICHHVLCFRWIYMFTNVIQFLSMIKWFIFVFIFCSLFLNHFPNNNILFQVWLLAYSYIAKHIANASAFVDVAFGTSRRQLQSWIRSESIEIQRMDAHWSSACQISIACGHQSFSHWFRCLFV